MKTILRIEANEIEKVESMTFYNHIMWKIKSRNGYGFTHMREVYDDVSDYPDYTFGAITNNGKEDIFMPFASGEGDPVPVDKIGYGGVWIDVVMFNDISTF